MEVGGSKYGIRWKSTEAGGNRYGSKDASPWKSVGSRYGSRWNSTKVYMSRSQYGSSWMPIWKVVEVNGSLCGSSFKSVEVDKEVDGSQLTPLEVNMEVRGSQWKSVEVHMIRGSQWKSMELYVVVWGNRRRNIEASRSRWKSVEDSGSSCKFCRSSWKLVEYWM